MKSGPQFIYSGESLFFGPTLVLFCSAFLSAKKLLDIRRSKYYAAFMVLTVLRMLDVCISSYVWTRDQNIVQYWFANVQTIVEWLAGMLLPILNLYRLHAICSTIRPRTVRILMGITGCCMILLSTSETMYIYAWTVGEGLQGTDMVYAAWSIVDCLLNTTISLVFVFHLEKVVGEANANHSSMRHMLLQVKILLISDVVTILASDVLQLSGRSLDPMWSLYFFAEAFRLCMLSKFLVLLNQLLRQKRRLIKARISTLGRPRSGKNTLRRSSAAE